MSAPTEEDTMNDSSNLPVPASGPAPTGVAYWDQRAADPVREIRHLIIRIKEEDDALSWGWLKPPPTLPELAALLLDWAVELDHKMVFDPDSRCWLQFNPARGYFSKMAGSAEQAARVVVAEAAERCRKAHDALARVAEEIRRNPRPAFDSKAVRAAIRAEYDQRKAEWLSTGGDPAAVPHFESVFDVRVRELLPRDVYGFVATGNMDAYARMGRILSGDSSSFEHSVSAIAQALVDAASAGQYAARTRAGIRAGESPNAMFLPMVWRADPGGWESVNDFGYFPFDVDDPELNAGDCYEVPLKAAGYAPDAAVPTPGFDRLCELVWPDPLVREAALRSLSMGFCGVPTKWVIFWRSETNRGKSLLAALMSNLLGGYARTIPAKLLFGFAADPQRAAVELDGTWLGVCEEGIGSGSFRASESFKAVTNGGGDLSARLLYRESRQVRATHTLLLCANAEADLDFTDDAILSRLVANPFTGDPAAIMAYAETYKPASEQWRREAPGVLARMLAYAEDFRTGKWRPVSLLDMKNAGMLASEADEDLALAIEMRTDSNVAAWIADRRSALKDREWSGRELYSLYKDWCSTVTWNQPDRGEVLTETKWGRELGKVPGVEKRKHGTIRYVIADPQ